jgi:hypothetical protein
MDRKVLWLLFVLVLVLVIATVLSSPLFGYAGATTKTGEGFQGLLPDSAVEKGQARFNDATNLVNILNPQIPIGTTPPDAFQKALGSVNVIPSSGGTGLPGAFDIQGVNAPYKIPADLPDNLRIAQTVCEAVKTPTCSAFSDPQFAANCGISFDLKGKDSRGKGHMGGLYISPDDRATQRQQAINNGYSPDDVRYQPTFGTAARGTFAIDASSCTVISEQVACTHNRNFNSPNCTQCFTSGAFNRVDPSTPLGPATFVVQTNATTLNFVAPTGTTPMTVTADTPLVVAPMPPLKEGDIYYFQLQGNAANLYFAGYITGQTAAGDFKLDLNALVDLDTVTNYKPRLGGTQDINGTRCMTLRPGIGQTQMNFRGHLPFTFLSPYEYDAKGCDNGPIITRQDSANFLSTDVCYTPTSTPGNYSLSCLQQTFVGMGGTTQGTGYPSDTTKARVLLLDMSGNARSLSAISDFLYDMNVKAATGRDQQGNSLTLADWNTASLFVSGTPVTSPCDGPNKETGPLTTECLQYLYTNGGLGNNIGATYSLGSLFASQDKQSNSVYCTPQGALSPSNPEGLKRAMAAGGVEAVKTLYDTAHKTANNNTLTNAQRASAIADCYGDTLAPKANEVFWVGGTPSVNPYTIASTDAASICQSFGAQVATPQQITDAQTAGAQWCTCGWATDGNAYYPMQQGDISGCGAAGVNNCGNMAWAQSKAGVNCYGPKPAQPPTNGPNTIAPFNPTGPQWNNPYS